MCKPVKVMGTEEKLIVLREERGVGSEEAGSCGGYCGRSTDSDLQKEHVGSYAK